MRNPSVSSLPKTYHMRVILFTFFLLVAQTLAAQEQTRVAITLSNGTEYIGTVTKDDGREVYLMTESIGGIYLLKTDIKSMKPVESEKQIVQGEFRDSSPFTTRYAFTTNALSINKGENYAMLNLYGPEIHMAVTNRLSIGVMSSWIGSPLILAAKFTIPTKNPNLNFSIGNLAATSGYIQSFRGYGDLAFANVTLGNRMNNITLAGGYFMYRGGGLDNFTQAMIITSPEPYLYDLDLEKGQPKPVHGPMFSIGGIARIGAKASFVFDSMLGFFEHEVGEVQSTELVTGGYQHEVVMKTNNSSALFVMPGVRFQRDERKAFQFSLAGVVINDGDGDVSAPFPMCSWFSRF